MEKTQQNTDKGKFELCYLISSIAFHVFDLVKFNQL